MKSFVSLTLEGFFISWLNCFPKTTPDSWTKPSRLFRCPAMKAMLCFAFLGVCKRGQWGGECGGRKQLAGVVLSPGMAEVSLPLMAAPKADLQDCIFLHTISEQWSKDRRKGWASHFRGFHQHDGDTHSFWKTLEGWLLPNIENLKKHRNSKSIYESCHPSLIENDKKEKNWI